MTPLPARRQTPNSIPITVLCGFPGAGKTTLLNHLLTQTGGQRIAVIVNEFGAVNVDASCVVKTDEEAIELSNGCICCTLRGDPAQAWSEIVFIGQGLDGAALDRLLDGAVQA